MIQASTSEIHSVVRTLEWFCRRSEQHIRQVTALATRQGATAALKERPRLPKGAIKAMVPQFYEDRVRAHLDYQQMGIRYNLDPVTIRQALTRAHPELRTHVKRRWHERVTAQHGEEQQETAA